MKIFYYTLLLVTSAIVFSCKKDDDPSVEVTQLMSIQVDDGFYGSAAEVWYVVWDDNGTLLDYVKLVPGPQTLNLTPRLAKLTTETLLSACSGIVAQMGTQ